MFNARSTASSLLGIITMPYVSAAGAGHLTLDAMLARDRALELPTLYVPPPGNPLDHHAAGFAQIMCSAVFITGLDPDFAAENVGYFTAPYAERAKLGKPVVDRAAKSVSVAVPGGAVRTAQYVGDQGCVTFPIGKSEASFKPRSIKSALPDAATQPWPMGDKSAGGIPPGVDVHKVNQALDAAFASP